MKITQIEVFYIPLLPETRQHPILIRVDTDEGVYGVGEVGIAYGTGAAAAAGIVKDLAPLIIGLDPFDTEAIWEKFYKRTFWGQSGGTIFYAGMSAIDIALWDIKGKALNVPVYKLLGGKNRESLRTYASQIQFGWGPCRSSKGPAEEYAAEAIKAVEDGYDAVKVDVIAFDERGKTISEPLEGPLPAKYIRLAEERIAAIREAAGPDVDIIVENHAKTDVTSAIQIASALEKYNIFFYEEINTPLNSSLLELARQKINIPIASGERIFTRWGCRPYFEKRLIDVIQPDLCTCGGLTEFAKIAASAHLYEITVQAHVAGSMVSEAAALHAEIAIPNFIIHEHHQKALIPEYTDLCTHNYQPVKGRYFVPELPGLGQDLTDKVYKLAERAVVR